MNAGLRYDAQFLPNPFGQTRTTLRRGLVLPMRPVIDAQLSVPALASTYDRVPLRATSNALQRDGSKYLVVQLAPTQAGAPVFPNILASQPAALITKPNITRIDPKIEAGYSGQASLQIERELSGQTAVSVGYLYLRGRHLILLRNVNVPTSPASAGVPNLGRPDPNWGNVSRYESSGDSYYNGLIVSLNKRATRWASMRISYTLSKAIDDTGNFFFSTPQNNSDVRDDRGLSENDQRHRLVVSGSLEAPQASANSPAGRCLRGFQLSYIFTAATQPPFNIVTGADRNFDTNNNDRPAGVGRNTGRGFGFASLDLRLARLIHLREDRILELTAEGFNLFNRANLGTPNNTIGEGQTTLATFGLPTAAFDPRQFQFGLRLKF